MHKDLLLRQCKTAAFSNIPRSGMQLYSSPTLKLKCEPKAHFKNKNLLHIMHMPHLRNSMKRKKDSGLCSMFYKII